MSKIDEIDFIFSACNGPFRQDATCPTATARFVSKVNLLSRPYLQGPLVFINDHELRSSLITAVNLDS